MCKDNIYLRGLDKPDSVWCHAFNSQGFTIDKFTKSTIKKLVELKIIVQSLASFDKWVMNEHVRTQCKVLGYDKIVILNKP